MRGLRQFGVPAGLISVALALTTALASAEPGSPETPPHMSPGLSDHAPVNAVAEALMRHEADSGFARVQVDYAKSAVIVYWKGEPGPSVKATIGATTEDVSVVLKQVDFTLAEFLDAGSKLLSTERGLGLRRTILGVMPREDLTGVIVQLTSEAPGWSEPAQTTETFERIVGMPVTLEETGPLTELSRQDDFPPWQGGGAIANSTGADYCSVGFAVLRNGNHRLLSARHCFYANGVGSVVRDGSGDRIGEVSNGSADGDTVLINPDISPGAIGKVYGGEWDAILGDPDYAFNVVGAANPAEDADVCTSGARSGQHCAVTAENTGKTFPCAYQLDGECQGFEARHNLGNVAAATGDSGAPVYHKFPNGVGARGVISNTTASSVTCGSVAEQQTTCYPWSNVVNIMWLTNYWDASVMQINP